MWGGDTEWNGKTNNTISEKLFSRKFKHFSKKNWASLFLCFPKIENNNNTAGIWGSLEKLYKVFP